MCPNVSGIGKKSALVDLNGTSNISRMPSDLTDDSKGELRSGFRLAMVKLVLWQLVYCFSVLNYRANENKNTGNVDVIVFMYLSINKYIYTHICV
jgi:hypothetical protein